MVCREEVDLDQILERWMGLVGVKMGREGIPGEETGKGESKERGAVVNTDGWEIRSWERE